MQGKCLNISLARVVVVIVADLLEKQVVSRPLYSHIWNALIRFHFRGSYFRTRACSSELEVLVIVFIHNLSVLYYAVIPILSFLLCLLAREFPFAVLDICTRKLCHVLGSLQNSLVPHIIL